MKVIPPLKITDAIFTSSTVAEPSAGETAWNAGTNYTLGTIVARATTHRLYQNLIAGTDATLPENAATRWLDIGATNKWAMFDLSRSMPTVSSGDLIVVLSPTIRLDSIAVMNIVGTSVTISITSLGVPVYSITQSLSKRDTLTWFNYFFSPFAFGGNALRFDLPPYANAVITVTITAVDGVAKCGALVIGNAMTLGKMLNEPNVDSLNFSRIERDQFGNATLVPRRTVPKVDAVTVIENGFIDSLRGLRETLNATPAVWSGLDDLVGNPLFESVFLLGIYKEFSIAPNSGGVSKVNLSLEEI